MSDQGRGRGRGRGRGGGGGGGGGGGRGRGGQQSASVPGAPQGAWGQRAQQQQQQQQQQQLQQQQSAPAQAAPQGAWGQRAQQQQQKQLIPQQQVASSAPQGAWASRAPQQSQPAQQSASQGASGYRGSQSQPSPQRSQPASRPPPQRAQSSSSEGSRPMQKDDEKDKKSRGRRRMEDECIVTRKAGADTKKGVTGRPVQLRANYFKLLSRTDWHTYQYDVQFNPDIDDTRIRKALLRDHKETLKCYMFDGAILYTSNRYAETKFELISRRLNSEEIVKITVTFTKELDPSDYQCLQVFNIVMRKCYELLKLQMVGRNYYDPCNKVVVPEYKLELWPGYVTTIRQYEQNIMMNADISFKVMRQQTAYDVMTEIRRTQRNFKDAVDRTLLNTVVMTPYTNNTYRIDDIDYNVNASSEFFYRKENRNITYIEYYKMKYNIKIQDVKQPLLVSKSKPKDKRGNQDDYVYLVPELCMLTGITDNMRNDFQLMKELALHTRVNPNERITKLLSFNNRLQKTPQIISEFKDWNLELDKQLVSLTGRELPPETIYAHNKVKCRIDQKFDWINDLRSKPLYSVVNIKDWCIIYPERFENATRDFIRNLTSLSRNFGMNLAPPLMMPLRDTRLHDYLREIENFTSKSNLQLVCCVIMSKKSDLYSAIKKKCTADRGVPSQVVVLKNITCPSNKANSIATKIGIQINCKLGGAPWIVEANVPGIMIVGYDVCHGTKSDKGDYGALVASIDKDCSQFFSKVTHHKHGEELSNFFPSSLRMALQEYNRKVGCLPSRIMIFRDGVGEGDLAYVKEFEVASIRKMLNEVYGGPDKARMAFLVVTKRINTRFMKETPRGSENPSPGTVIDDVVTHPWKYDFYLVSQCVNEGTVTPTSYHILDSNIGLNADVIQRLTYKYTFNYYNWTGPVRVPAPCQYAHKLAFQVSQSIKSEPNNSLNTLLHYL